MGALEDLIGQAVYLQNAGNYVRLVAHVGETVKTMEHALHHVNQRKPFSSVIQRSLAAEKKRKAQENAANASASGDASSASSKTSSRPRDTEFDALAEIMINQLLSPVIKLLEIDATLQPLGCENLKSQLSASLTSLASRCESEFKALYTATLEALNWSVMMPESAGGNFSEASLHFFKTAFVLIIRLQRAIWLSASASVRGMSSDQFGEGNTRDRKSAQLGQTATSSASSSSHSDKNAALTSLEIDSPRLWCMELLVKPLQVRFNFNFRGRESTNRYDRPEWHFTYVRQLLKNHDKFLEFVTSLLHSMGLNSFDAKHEVLRGLIVPIKEKLVADLNLIISMGPHPSSNAQRGAFVANPANAVPSAAPSQFSKMGNLVLSGSNFLGGSSGGILGSPIGSSSKNEQNSTSSVSGPGSRSSVLSAEVVSALLSHTINEILDFEKTLTDVFEYPSGRHEDFPRPIDVLALPEFHSTWLELEVATMRQHLRAALDAPDAWERQYATVPASDDPTRVPRHCFIFFNVLSILQERYQLLGAGREEQMSEFLEQQLALLTDYLDEMKDSQTQSLRELDGLEYLKQCCVLYNAAWYARKILEDWGSHNLYVSLYMWNKRITDVEKLSGTVFDPLIQQCKALCKHNLKLMVEKTHQIFVSAYNKSYARVNFLDDRPEVTLILQASSSSQRAGASSSSHGINLDISPLLCDVLFLTREAFTCVESSLNQETFHKYWRSLAHSMNTFLFESLITKRHFNIQGAIQLRTDMHALWLLWSSQTAAPHSYFKETYEAITILNFSSEEIQELNQLLNSLGRNPTAQQSAELHRFGLFNLSAPQVRQVIDKRIDKKNTSYNV
jgi:hypothetical protein